MSKETGWDTEKGELRIQGRRHTAIDAQALCEHLDSLVGIQVAEVIMTNLEYRLGKLDAEGLKAERTRATLGELIEELTNTDRLSGLGIIQVRLPQKPQAPVQVELKNPSVKGTAGAAKAFAFAWWAGVLSVLLGGEFDLKNVTYSQEENLMKCQIVPR